jgi:hypothetical protein
VTLLIYAPGSLPGCGSETSTVEFRFTCSNRELPSDSYVFNVTELSPCYSIIEFPTSIACKTGGGGGDDEGGISTGTSFLLIFFLGGGGLMAIGSYYKYAVGGKRGAEMIPLIGLWRALPGLVWAGMVFAASGCPSNARYGGVSTAAPGAAAPGVGGGYENIA